MELATALEELNKAKAMIEIVTDDRNQYADRYNQANAENTRLQRALDALQAQLARWKEALGEWGGLGGCGYEGRKYDPPRPTEEQS